MSQNQYWFHGQAKDVASAMERQRQSWLTYGMNPIYQAWVRNMISYYSTVLKANAWDTSLVLTGEQGELVEMSVPQARSLIRQLVGLVTKQRLAFTTTADTKGMDVIQASRIGNALSAQIVNDHRMDAKADLLAEIACVYGASWMHTAWRSDRGKPFVPDVIPSPEEDGDPLTRILYNGDIEFQVLTPFDLIYDYRVEEWENMSWVEVRTVKNRWDLVAQFPEMEDVIKRIPSTRKQTPLWAYQQETAQDSDSVYVYSIYHALTPALPNGRMIVHAGADCILYDDHNPYKAIPVEMCMPEKIHGMCLGYPILSNLLPGQEMLDHSFSVIASNQSAFGVQNICAPRGSGLSVEDVGGMNWISFTPQNVPGGGKPESLQLSHTSPETFKFIDLTIQHMQQISNLNSTIRGAPPSGMNAGVAIATMTANALEFLNAFSKAWSICVEKSMERAVINYQLFGHLPHQVTLAGKNNMSFTKDFVSEDIKAIRGVKFQLSNPMMNTIAGRSDIAEKLLPTGLIKNAQQYFSILDGAPVSELYEDELSENDLVHDENEALIEGGQVKALSTDDHASHVRSHASLLNKNTVRLNSDKVQAILEHIMEHKQLSETTDPALMAMVRTGKMPNMMAPGPGGPPQGPVGPQNGPMGPENPMKELPIDNKPAMPANPAADALGRAM